MGRKSSKSSTAKASTSRAASAPASPSSPPLPPNPPPSPPPLPTSPLPPAAAPTPALAPAYSASSSYASAFSSPWHDTGSPSVPIAPFPLMGAAASQASVLLGPLLGASSSYDSAFSSPSHDAFSPSLPIAPFPLMGAAASQAYDLLGPLLGASGSFLSGPSAIDFEAPQFPPGVTGAANLEDLKKVAEKNILDLMHKDRRENALAELSKLRLIFPDLAPFVWFSFGTVAILLQELLSIYPLLSSLTPAQSNRVCNALALLQCVASHPTTRICFAKAQIPFYLYVFLNIIGESTPYEHLRLATLGVICALVKVPDTEMIVFLLSSEVMPLCLRSMQCGSEMSRAVATLILERLLMDDVGLQYVCDSADRLDAVHHALENVFASLATEPSPRLLKFVIRCYHRFLYDERSHWALINFLSKALTDGTFHHCLRREPTVRMRLQQLLDYVRGLPFMQGSFCLFVVDASPSIVCLHQIRLC